jgi:hypothetical protein
MTPEKTREIRIRRTLDRRGYTLSKSRRRDPHALDYGRYTISDGTGTAVFETTGLDGVETWIATSEIIGAVLDGLHEEIQP